MFESDEVIYVQMQKTASTHIAKILGQLFDPLPESLNAGKHVGADERQIRSGKLILSSIRNPWDWYVSLWTFGAHGLGGLRNRLVSTRPSQPPRDSSAHDGSGNSQTGEQESLTSVVEWQRVYADPQCRQAFRKWLTYIHRPCNSEKMGERYGRSAVNGLCGFMTYRYLYLCCRNREILEDSNLIGNYHELADYERSHCYIDYFIRQESLEHSLCEAMKRIRPLTRAEQQIIYLASKTNVTKRPFPLSHYYDKESIAIIQKRERLLIEKFGYSSPEVSC